MRMVRSQRLGLALVLVALLALCVSAVPEGQDAEVSVVKEARVENGYIVVKTTVESQKLSFTRLVFNLTGVKEKLVVAYTLTEEGKAPARIEGDLLVFPIPGARSRVELVEVYTDIMKYTPRGIEVLVPLTLSPVGLRSKVNVTVTLPTMHVRSIEPANLSLTELGDVKFSALVEGGNITVIRLAMDPTRVGLLVVESIERTIVIDSPKYAVFYDNLSLVSTSATRAPSLTLRLPTYVEVVEVRGPIAPYPEDPLRGYTVKTEDNATVLTVRLRAPPVKYGDRAFVTVAYKVNITRSGAEHLVPAYIAPGPPIVNYTITLKVRGSFNYIKPAPKATYRQGDYSVAILSQVGPLFEDLKGDVAIGGLSVSEPGPPLRVIIAVLLVVLLSGVLAFVYKRRVPVTEETEGAEEESQLKLSRVVRKRVETLEGMLSAWSSYTEGKISWQTYRQRVSALRRREEALRREVSKLAQEVTLSEKAKSLLSDLDDTVRSFQRTLKNMEKTAYSYRRGLLSKSEYRSKLDSLYKQLEDTVEKAYRIAASLESA